MSRPSTRAMVSMAMTVRTIDHSLSSLFNLIALLENEGCPDTAQDWRSVRDALQMLRETQVTVAYVDACNGRSSHDRLNDLDNILKGKI